MSPSTKRNFLAAAAGEVQALQEKRAPLRRREDLQDLLRLVVADRLGPDDRHHLLDAPVARRLGEDLLAHEARGAGEKDPEPGIAPPGGEPRPGLLLERVDARLDFLFREVGRLPELEGERPGRDPHELLGLAAPGSGLPVTNPTPSPTSPPRRLTALSPFLTKASLPVSWMKRLAANWAAISTGWLSRWACTSSSWGSMGSVSSAPVARSTLMM